MYDKCGKYDRTSKIHDIKIASSCTESWYNLVHDAQDKSHQQLNEDLESYLIFLLIRFTNNTQLANSILSIEYLESQSLHGVNQQEHLRDIGDKCLLFAGFYPEQAHKKLVSLGYFVDLGRSAYDQIAKKNIINNQSYKGLNKLFTELTVNFVNLLNILNQIKLLDITNAWVPDQIIEFERKMLGNNQIIISQNIH
jgi:hypothetical protein